MSSPLIFDPALGAQRRARARRLAVPGADFLLARTADDLADRLATLTRRFEVAVDLGRHAGAAAPVIASADRATRVLVAPTDPDTPGDVMVDEEALALAPGSVDLVVSLMSLHEVNDLPGALVQIRRALRPDGLFLAAMPGGATLTELRESLLAAEVEATGGASPRVSPFVDVRDLGGLLQRAGFALPVTDTDRFTVRYDSMFALIRDLRAMGATSILTERSRRPLPRSVFLRAAAIYAERHADPDGRVRATFEIVSASGWAPHESQQKPLKPGSASARLADALNTREWSTGESPAGAEPGPANSNRPADGPPSGKPE